MAQASSTATCVTQPSTAAVETLTLTLVPRRRKKKAIKWSEDVVEVNEFTGKKSSKKCCIFHRRRKFGDWSDDDDSDLECSNSETPGGTQQQKPAAQTAAVTQQPQPL